MADNKNDDEDLMSDFRDLFPGDDSAEAEVLTPPEDPDTVATEAVVSQPDTDDLDELDSFLDGFSQGLGRLNGVDEPEGGGDASLGDAPEVTSAATETILAEPESTKLESEPTEDEPELFELGVESVDAVSEPVAQIPEPNQAGEADEIDDDAFIETIEAGSERQGGLETEDLDLAVGSLPDTDIDESESEAGGVGAELVPIAAAAAAAAAATAAAQSAVAPPASTPAAAAVSGQTMGAGKAAPAGRMAGVALGLALLGLGAAMAALAMQWMQPATQQQVELAPRPDALAIDRLRADVVNLTARINELALILEGPMSHLREANEGALEALQRRLDKLESTATVGTMTAPANTTKPTQSKPAAAKPTPASPLAEGKPQKPAPVERAGGWSINLVSLSNEKDAKTEMARLRQQGIRVEMQLAVRDGRTWYRLQVPGFDSYEGARAYIDTIQKQTGVSNAWVSRD